MPTADIPRGLAFASFFAGLVSCVGPSYHVSQVPVAFRSQRVTREGQAIGVFFGLAGILLAVYSYRGYSKRTDRANVIWAKIGFAASLLGLILTTSLLTAR